jgi:glycosyltransferase involved in cell wall biosynthesis
MRFFLIIDDYMPDTTKIAGKMMHELAIELVRNGHEVSVCTPTHDSSKAGTSLLDGVTVHRFSSGAIKNQPRWRRLFNEVRLSRRAWKSLQATIRGERADGIVYYSPSIFWGSLVRKLKKTWGCPSYLVLRDIFPQWAVDAGLIRENSLTHRFFEHFEAKSYAAANCIAVQSPRNLSLVLGKAPAIEVLYNWAGPDNKKSGPWLRSKYDLKDKVVFFYGGNIGVAQDLSNVVRLAERLREHKHLVFVIIGRGDEFELIRRLASQAKLENIVIDDAVNQEQYYAALDEVDVGLLTLNRNHSSDNYPGKLLGYLQAGLPILASLNPQNDLIDLINETGCGFAQVNGDDESLAASTRLLADDLSLRKKMKGRSTWLLQNRFDVGHAAKTITEFFNRNCTANRVQ